MNIKLTRSPSSPGEILSEIYMYPLSLTPQDLSQETELPLATINGILKNHVAINNTIADALAKRFGTSSGFWLNLQANYSNWSPEDM